MLKISEEEYREIEAAAKANKNKRVAKRLEVLEMRYAKKSNTEIAAKTGFNKLYVTTLIQIYKRQGLAEYIRIKQTSHRRNLSEAEEAEILAECEEEAEAGQMLTAEAVRRKLGQRRTKRPNGSKAIQDMVK